PGPWRGEGHGASYVRSPGLNRGPVAAHERPRLSIRRFPNTISKAFTRRSRRGAPAFRPITVFLRLSTPQNHSNGRTLLSTLTCTANTHSRVPFRRVLQVVHHHPKTICSIN